jgi:hypothetical protein
VLIALEEQILFASFTKSGCIIFSQQYDEVNRERELMKQIRIQILFPSLLMMENSPESHNKFMTSTHAGTRPTKLALKQMGTHAVPGWWIYDFCTFFCFDVLSKAFYFIPPQEFLVI